MRKVRYRYCTDCGEVSEIATRISRCSKCWEKPLSEQKLPDGTSVRTYKDCQTITPAEPLGATAYKEHPKHYRALSKNMASVLKEAATEIQIFTRDRVDHILSLDFLAEIFVSQEKFSDKVLKNATREMMFGLFNWHRSVQIGVITDFERQSYAALMRLHRPSFLKLMSTS